MDELALSLTHVQFLASAHSEALDLFQQTADGFGRRFGPDDDVRLYLYYMAACRMELGETTAAIAAYQAYIQHSPDEEDAAAVARIWMHSRRSCAWKRSRNGSGSRSPPPSPSARRRAATAGRKPPD
ncbi:hypothetical protein AB0H17_07000 [Streptomyces olivoreticuli]